MRASFTDATWVSQYPTNAADISGGAFDSCFFDNCRLDSFPAAKNRIRGTVFRNCRQRSSSVAGAVIEDVLVDGLKNMSDMPLFLEDSVFRHVTLRGRISQFKINPSAEVAGGPASEALAIAGHRAFYEDVDWALDITEAEFTFGPDLQFVPGSLIRFDPATQARVRRSSFEGVDCDALPWKGSDLEIGLEWFLEDGPYDEAVLVAPRKAKSFKRDLAAIEMLRERGLAEPA